jgi:hypothetical protein
VSKDTWSLLVDFIRSIDADFKEHDEEGESSDFSLEFQLEILGRCG